MNTHLGLQARVSDYEKASTRTPEPTEIEAVNTGGDGNNVHSASVSEGANSEEDSVAGVQRQYDAARDTDDLDEGEVSVEMRDEREIEPCPSKED